MFSIHVKARLSQIRCQSVMTVYISDDMMKIKVLDLRSVVINSVCGIESEPVFSFVKNINDGVAHWYFFCVLP